MTAPPPPCSHGPASWRCRELRESGPQKRGVRDPASQREMLSASLSGRLWKLLTQSFSQVPVQGLLELPPSPWRSPNVQQVPTPAKTGPKVRQAAGGGSRDEKAGQGSPARSRCGRTASSLPAHPLEQSLWPLRPSSWVKPIHSLPGTAWEAAKFLWLSPWPLELLPALPLTWSNHCKGLLSQW